MEIQQTVQTARQHVTMVRAEKTTGSFDKLLAGTLTPQTHASGQQQKNALLQEIGTITKQTPTVSQLLHRHEGLKGDKWRILANNHNKHKDYTSIRPGTKIYINRTSGELSWAGAVPKQTTTRVQVAGAGMKDASRALRQAESGPVVKQSPPAETRQPVRLGFISSDNPTVSHLLRRDSRFHDQAWDILDRSVNVDKPFHRMPNGSAVLLNPETMEISWRPRENTPNQTLPAVTAQAKKVPLKRTPPGNHDQVADLSQAVQPYMGKSYKEINCFELLVNGLKQLDIPYAGRNGLYSRLTRMALDRGMAANAYLNGEGIVEVAGSTVLAKNYPELEDWKKNAAELIREIEPLLNNGQILSFSTQTRGHTGIVSRQDDRWTFINSGRLDNPVGERDLGKGVGEEILDKEIRNWFKLAHANGEPLRVTLGELNQDKIRTAASIGELPDKRS